MYFYSRWHNRTDRTEKARPSSPSICSGTSMRATRIAATDSWAVRRWESLEARPAY